MPDPEFLEPTDPDGADEVLDNGPRRRRPRWLGPLVVAGVLALIVALVVVRVGGSNEAAPAPSTTAAPGSAVTDGPATPSGPVADLVSDPRDGLVIGLFGSVLYAFDTRGRVVGTSVGIQVGNTSQEVALSYDATRDVVWAVRQGLPIENRANPGVVQGFSARTLKQVSRVVLPAPCQGSTVLDGALYIIASGRLYRTTPGDARFTPVANLGLDAGTPIADPTRHRLLYAERSNPQRLAVWSSSGRRTSVVLPFDGGEVEVVAGTIWAGGTAADGAVLRELDPRTLQPRRNLASSLPVGGSLVLAGTGQRSLFVRPIRGASAEVLCLDGTTGALRSRLPQVTGLFTTLDGRGYVGAAGGVSPLDLGRCPG